MPHILYLIMVLLTLGNEVFSSPSYNQSSKTGTTGNKEQRHSLYETNLSSKLLTGNLGLVPGFQFSHPHKAEGRTELVNICETSKCVACRACCVPYAAVGSGTTQPSHKGTFAPFPPLPEEYASAGNEMIEKWSILKHNQFTVIKVCFI